MILLFRVFHRKFKVLYIQFPEALHKSSNGWAWSPQITVTDILLQKNLNDKWKEGKSEHTLSRYEHFQGTFQSSFNRSYLLPGSLHTKNFQSYRIAVTSLLPADPNSAPHGKFLFLLPLSCSQTSSDGGTMSCLEANFSQRTSTL